MARTTKKMADSVTYREKRRKDSVKKFLNGKARRPYVLREDIFCGLKGQAINCFGEESENINSSSCACPILFGTKIAFQSIVRR